jgi:gamma-glutamyl:cysteine ligase YbdK (ATP-grasp superfamily)
MGNAGGTVEVRVGDVCPTADDTVLVAALIRALVATMIDDERAGAPSPLSAPPCCATATSNRS